MNLLRFIIIIIIIIAVFIIITTIFKVPYVLCTLQ